MIEFIAYIPLAIITITVLELCKSDDLKVVAKRVAKGFLSLTLIGVVVTVVAYLFLGLF